LNSFKVTDGVFENLVSGFALSAAPIVEINSPLLDKKGISLSVKREDLIHPLISGNKWHKLKYNIQQAKSSGFNTILTFGGAYSNHIYSTAAAGSIFRINTIGIIRGEEHLPLNPTLEFAAGSGMNIQYVSRKDYRNRNSNEFVLKLKEKFGKFYLVPEGGTNSLAVLGSMEILSEQTSQYDYICSPCGTGGTIAGLIKGSCGHQNVLGFSVLKGGEFLKDNVKTLLKDDEGINQKKWAINTDYHFGGYAKFNSELIDFTSRFINQHRIPVEPIYTGKMFFGIFDLAKKNFFRPGTSILAVHTGGLQGINGLIERFPGIFRNIFPESYSL
jgi:1-aminocyclopropane-1-carboxylate deaminase/D-cysteine desulfhydrase-like pyridoxal-dependent ACC family enzyme